MLNLLPEDMRGFHKRRMLNSVAFVWGVSMLLLLGIGLLTLIPAYSYTLVRNKKDPEQVKTEQKTHELAEAMQRELENDTIVALYLKDFFKTQTFTSLYAVLTETTARHPKISVESVLLSRVEKTNTLAVRGRAEEREQLVAFVRDLESQGTFKKVSLPIGDLAGRDGVFDFTLTLQTAL